MKSALWLLIHLLAAIYPAYAVEVEGHRGSRWTHPENTIPGLHEALVAGADALEFDLGMTREGVLILSHDPIINPRICRKMNGLPLTTDWIIRQRTVTELKSLDCGAMINPRFRYQRPILGTKMPTLEEVLEWLSAHPHPNAGKIKLNIETKVVPGRPLISASPEEFAAEIIRLLERFDLTERSVIQSFEFDSLRAVRKLKPGVRISLLVRNQTWSEISLTARELSANVLSPPERWITGQITSNAQKGGLKVVPWTVNTMEGWDRLIGMGVDGIITDRPRDLIEYLGKARSGAEKPRRTFSTS